MDRFGLEKPNNMTLSIVIVNFNGRHFLDDCLRSISKQVPFDHEVIIVDNASTDGSVEYLRKAYSQVRLIENEENLGFARANNIGANDAKGDFLLLLNNDTILLDDLTSAIAILKGDESVGILGARMLGKDGEYRHSSGYFPEPLRLFKLSSLYRKDGGFGTGDFEVENSVYPVDWVEGSFLLTRMSLWRDIGGLDESYFMYVEDIDYAKMALLLGKQAVFFPDISYMHFGGYGPGRIGMLIKGFRRYHDRHSNWLMSRLAYIVLDGGLIIRAIVYALRSIGNHQEIERARLCLKALRR